MAKGKASYLLYLLNEIENYSGRTSPKKEELLKKIKTRGFNNRNTAIYNIARNLLSIFLPSIVNKVCDFTLAIIIKERIKRQFFYFQKLCNDTLVQKRHLKYLKR